MIVIDLCCDKDHRFEGWFASAEAFDQQHASQMVSCPVCASTTVRRLPSAPYVQTRTAAAAPNSSSTPPSTPPGAPSGTSLSPATAAAVLQMLRHMSRNAEDVGERLPEEARRIHYGNAEARDIRGQASPEDVEDLLEEGIVVVPLPPTDDEVH